MPDKSGNLYFYEAIELRNEYGSKISLIQQLTEAITVKNVNYYPRNEQAEERAPVDEFNLKEEEKKLKKLITKRLKFNQEIQKANFNVQFDFISEKVSITETL